MANPQLNIDPAEIDRFGGQADRWWHSQGPYKALHQLNPVRLGYIQQRIGLGGAKVLDVGCGGGLLSEAMANRGACVTGIDMDQQALEIGRSHADRQGLTIDYRSGTAEDWAAVYPRAYDLVTCMELVEHVPAPNTLVTACADLTRAGGHVVFATVSRTWLARLLVIWASEYILGIVPRDTHHYQRFVRPQELKMWAEQAGLCTGHLTGVRFLPYIGYVRLCKNTSMNYMMDFIKKTDDT